MEVLVLLFFSAIVLLALSLALILICLRNRKQHSFSFDELERYRCEPSPGSAGSGNLSHHTPSYFCSEPSPHMCNRPFKLSSSKHHQNQPRLKGTSCDDSDYISSAHSGLKQLKGFNKKFAIEDYFILHSLFEKSRKLYRAARKRSKTSFMPTKLTVVYEELSE
jgi:hypothetical protein